MNFFKSRIKSASPTTSDTLQVTPALTLDDVPSMSNFISNNMPIIPSVSSESSSCIRMLIPLAEEIQALPLFKSIGEQLLSAIKSSPEITRVEVSSILEKGDLLIANYSQTPTLHTQFQQYLGLLDEMLRLAPLDSSLTHENLVQSNMTSTLQSFTKYYNICEKLLVNFSSPTLKASFDALTQPLTHISTAFNELITFFKSFKSREESLRQDIENYSQALAQIHSQGVNIDWGGKKEAFQQKNNELTNRRSTYVQEESHINARITSLCEEIIDFQFPFKDFLMQLKEEISQQLAAAPPDTRLAEQERYKALCKEITKWLAQV